MKKHIVVAITGSIAAYKAANLVSMLQKRNYEVEVVMSKNATKFIAPLTFESLIKKPVLVDLFDKSEGYTIKHIELAKWADCYVIVPATANIIAKVANGIADDMLSASFLAATCPKIIAPAMNVHMYENIVTQRNIKQCQEDGMLIVSPDEGMLACGDVGKGKLAKEEDIIEMIEYSLEDKPLCNQKVLVSAGPTLEAIDPVRYITNHSSGKMGYALAKKAYQMGADVTLISGPTHIKVPTGIKTVYVTSANDMFEAIKERYDDQDFIIKAAAVGDYRPTNIAKDKIKKSNDAMVLELVKNPDILKFLGDHKKHHILCGFAMETKDLKENAKQKLKQKNCDMIVANNLKDEGAGFQGDTNKVLFITKEEIQSMPLLTKEELSKEILLKLISMKGDRHASSN